MVSFFFLLKYFFADGNELIPKKRFHLGQMINSARKNMIHGLNLNIIALIYPEKLGGIQKSITWTNANEIKSSSKGIVLIPKKIAQLASLCCSCRQSDSYVYKSWQNGEKRVFVEVKAPGEFGNFQQKPINCQFNEVSVEKRVNNKIKFVVSRKTFLQKIYRS